MILGITEHASRAALALEAVHRRLRAAGVPLETRKVLLRHKNGDITSHYSAPELGELLEASNRVCGGGSRKSTAMTLLKRKIA